MNVRQWIGLCAVALLGAGCPQWQHNVTLNGIEFVRARQTEHLLIGELRRDTLIGGRLCAQGWVHIHPNGVPGAFLAADVIRLPQFTIPIGTWVMQDREGVVKVCSFPREQMVQGHVCRGTGGPKGTQTAFYPSGALRRFYPARDTRIDGVPCRSNVFSGWVDLHENGRLKSCLLSEEWESKGMRYRRGTRLEIAADGKPLPPPLPVAFDPTGT